MTAALLALLLAAPRGEIVLAPAAARPGDAVLVRVGVARGAPLPTGTLGGRPLAFFPVRDEAWALAALPIETPPGPLPVALDAGAAASLEVVEPGFPSRALTVPARYVEPPAAVRARLEADRRAFAEAYDRPFAPPLFSSPFALPRRARLTGRYGDQRVLNGKAASVHYGLDLDGRRGAPVNAANDGEVVLVRDAWLSGKSVVLWHGADVYTIYFHLDRILVKDGAKVRKGQRIGRVGSTGRSTGPHLHWSARVAGLLVDPESLLAIDLREGTAPPRRARAPAPAAPPPAEAPLPAAEAHAGPAADPATSAPPR